MLNIFPDPPRFRLEKFSYFLKVTKTKRRHTLILVHRAPYSNSEKRISCEFPVENKSFYFWKTTKTYLHQLCITPLLFVHSICYFLGKNG